MASIIADYEFCEPKGSAEIAARDKLLQECLRSGLANPYPIAAEYPLVLDPARTSHSLCIARKGQRRDAAGFLAHASLLMRRMTPAAGDPARAVTLGLVGNVATSLEERGKGWMRTLIAEVEARAIRQGADAIVLWSDLDGFYQKLGFVPGGKEIRFNMAVRRLDCGKVPLVWVPDGYAQGRLADGIIRRMLELRTTGYSRPLYQIERTIGEFRELLRIPDLALFLASRHAGNMAQPDQLPPEAIEAFFIVGKGADMQGVIHEWGTSDLPVLLNAAGAVAGNAGLAELMILVPSISDAQRLDMFAGVSGPRETHPMAWVKVLRQERKTPVELALNEGFIWGLDSI
ncbi:MAG: hypothetical protein RIQ81_2294 [Pseudomonadota bacterium]|jgi:GNAT superfamily N-acetyltransferase